VQFCPDLKHEAGEETPCPMELRLPDAAPLGCGRSCVLGTSGGLPSITFCMSIRQDRLLPSSIERTSMVGMATFIPPPTGGS
jgi:hypothetical protein